MKLIPLSDFVLAQEQILEEVYSNFEHPSECDKARLEFVVRVTNYTKFLKQPLTLGMFVSCDEVGNVLERPYFDGKSEAYYAHEKHSYEAAQEKVLFKGFEYSGVWGGFYELKHSSGKSLYLKNDSTGTTEKQLLSQPHEIELTPSALEAIGIKN
ncbi:hypothetical protein [Chryseobacterium aquifrigidense]|uniref:Uncharacterized protein n=1 Tax=Chryseobacterium aquifrigidense TaxID=558021 RepID=A0A543E9S8_9FLAO|nr:hypothetical protein [Chryseobacterium aquifrigidense]TQM18351.1 hypothetical protein FB551_4132 [Chryseobacterium aquifrigidense]